ncbi:unnamed protein product [Polarella glacialis]|uniref:Uncharacterized protein n=1 Tax=Polarella glacialis TaxID=89957 RepID=A0A813LTZ6_POLGL|nr:unnamed protein product [Polarella glacialis]
MTLLLITALALSFTALSAAALADQQSKLWLAPLILFCAALVSGAADRDWCKVEFLSFRYMQQQSQQVAYHHHRRAEAAHQGPSGSMHIFGHQRPLCKTVPFVTLSTAGAGSSRSDDESGSAVAAAGCRACSSATRSSSEASSMQASAPAQAPGEPPSAAARALPTRAWRSNPHAMQAVLTVDIMLNLFIAAVLCKLVVSKLT